MATPVFCCGFECGASGNAGQHWSFGATASFNTNGSFVRSGLRSIRINPSAATSGSASSTSIATSNIIVLRCYIYFSSLPLANSRLISVPMTNAPGAYFKQSDSKIYAGFNISSPTFSATGVTVTTGVWYRLDVRINAITNPWTIDVAVDGTGVTQLTNAVAAETANTVSIGNSTTATTCDFYVDDLIVSATTADYPIGEGKVIGYVPNADGTHTSTGTTTVKGTIATPVGTAITSATTDAFNWVNGRPILGGATDNTRLINAQTNAATTYVEVAFEDSVEDRAPRSVEVLTADRQAATTTGDMSVKLNDNGTENTIIARSGAAGTTTDKYVTKQYATPPTGGTWNLNGSGAGSFQNIKARFGYSGDATPDQYWRGIMIEAEYDTTAIVAATDLDPMGMMGFFGL